MSAKSFSLVSLLSLFTFAASLSGCMGDKTAPEYAKQLAEQEQAKLQTIEGVYRGTLISNETQQAIGTLELHIDPSSDAQDASDNVTKMQKPVVEGTLIYSGLNQSEATFDDYYYDDDSGVFKFSIDITDSAGQKRTIKADGTIRNGTYTGSINLSGGFGATFSLTKDAPVTQLQRLKVGRAIAIAASSEDFHGVSQENPGGVYDMQIDYPNSRADLLFLNIFLRERAVNISMNVDGTELSFNVNNGTGATIDEKLNRLTGTTSTSFNGKTYPASLKCSRSNQGTPNETWDCWVTNDQAKTHILFSYAQNAQSEAQGR